MIHFASPMFLWLLLLLPVLHLWRGRRGKAPALGFSSTTTARAIAGRARTRWGRFLVVIRGAALAFGIIALARPQVSWAHTEVQASGVDLMLAVDVSSSMSSLDFKQHGKPVSRLAVVESVVSKFIKNRPNDRIGLIAFARRPYLVSPLTLDHGWLLHNMKRVKIGMVEDGTAIGSAIAASVNRLRDQHSKSKVVILLTDGNNNAGRVQPALAAQAARALGVRVYTIGVGSKGEAPMPVTDKNGHTHIVMTRVDVDVKSLRQIAKTTGAEFFRATDTSSLEKIYSQIDHMEKTTRKIQSFEHHQDRFAWAAIPAVLLVSMELGLGLTRFKRVP